MSSVWNGKVCIVTGAGRGMGSAVAERLAADGFAVAVNYASSAARANAVVGRIVAAGGRAVPLQADVSDRMQAHRLVEQTLEAFKRVDVLVNNAGIAEFAALAAIEAGTIQRQVGVNLCGVLWCAQAVATWFGADGGRIINLSSVVAERAPPGAAVYAATKAAVEAMTPGARCRTRATTNHRQRRRARAGSHRTLFC